MENATKAFLMAAGVLIGILILTAFIFVFRKGGQMLETVDNKESSEAIAEYNSKLITYNRNNNNIFDIITVCNMAYDINTQNMFDNINGLSITIIINEDDVYTLQRDDASQEKGKIEGNKLTDFIAMDIDGKTLGTIERREENLEDGTSQIIQEYIHTFTGVVIYDSIGKINQITFTLN